MYVADGKCLLATQHCYFAQKLRSSVRDGCTKSLQEIVTKIHPADIDPKAFPSSGAVIFGINRLHELIRSDKVPRSLGAPDADDETNQDGRSRLSKMFRRWSKCF